MATAVAPEQAASIDAQCRHVLETAGIKAEVVAMPGYLSVHVTSWEDGEYTCAILSLRDDLRFWALRKFGIGDESDSYVLSFRVVKK